MGDWLGVAARVDSNASTLGPARPSAARRSAKGRHAGATAPFPATFPAWPAGAATEGITGGTGSGATGAEPAEG